MYTLIAIALELPLLAVALTIDGAREWRPGQPVNTTSGMIIGRPATSLGHETVSEYLSIPYAAPPVGNLRWQAPQPYKPNSPVNASKWGPSCPQGDAASISEDCLTLNIWTKPQTGEAKKAVLISIYGGGFNVGSSNTRYLIGSALAHGEDVVVVSMNYRLNVFGFPGAIPGIPDANMGMLDIRASVEWIRDNIGAFGGDPKRMTLFGESGGGGATDYYAFAWAEDPIVAGFIPMSGSVWTRGIAVPATGNEDAWYDLSKKLGCGGRESGVKTLECLKKKDFREIVRHLRTGPRVPGKTFGAVHDSKTIFSESEYNERARHGRIAKIPTLTGNTDNEGGFFKLMKNLSSEDVLNMNACFTCTARKSADVRFLHKVPVWRYRWFGDFDNNRHMQGQGAYHGSELPFVFGTPKTRDGKGRNTDSKEEKELTTLMMKMWAAFAKDPVQGLSNFEVKGMKGLKMYDPTTESVILLGKDNKAEIKYAKAETFEADCPRYESGEDSIHAIMERSPENKGSSMPGLGSLTGEDA